MTTNSLSVNTHTNLSEGQIHNFLRNEFDKRRDLKILKEKVSTAPADKDGYNMIYKFKYEKSKGDTLFSTPGEISRMEGSALGVRTASYVDLLHRYNLSKTLTFKANELERNKIRTFTNCLMKNAFRHKWNYLLKASLIGMFLFNLCKANENRHLFYLRRVDDGKSQLTHMSKIYYNAAVSFGFAFIVCSLI